MQPFHQYSLMTLSRLTIVSKPNLQTIDFFMGIIDAPTEWPFCKTTPVNRATPHMACKEHVVKTAAQCPSTLGVGVKLHIPGFTPATTPFSPEQSDAVWQQK
ncbi:jg5053 [Pararge aegeria aegeria]|uniref:Jg5053 protein n=1 Tax=Pararge aegeria aegeria TaxID=348720 RepID=A0A8S4SLQ3_9NEOP|nr:jg5053 [Pararge aegeria aegeria]